MMKPEQVYQNLKELAEKLDVMVSEQNFRNAGIKVKSGLCRVRGQKRFIIDKHLSLYRKNKLLAACLSRMPHEEIYIVPAVRELLTSGKLPAEIQNPEAED